MTTYPTISPSEALTFAAKLRAQAVTLRAEADKIDQLAETWDHAILALGIKPRTAEVVMFDRPWRVTGGMGR